MFLALPAISAVQDSQKLCLTPAEIAAAASSETLKTFKDASITSNPKHCWKTVLVRNNSKFVIFRVLDGVRKGEITSWVTHVPRDANPGVCFQRSLTYLASLGDPSVGRLLLRAHKDLLWMWDDPDIGPASWLSCETPWLNGEKKADSLYYFSLGQLIRLLQYQLYREAEGKACFYSAASDAEICWEGLQTLPPLNALTFSNELDSDKELLLILKKEYEGPNRIFELLKKLNSESLRTRFQVLLLEKEGPDSLFSEENPDVDLTFPAVARLTSAYFLKLKKESPETYTRFLEAGHNRESLRLLMKETRESSNLWQTALEKKKRFLNETEIHFWKTFQKESRKLPH